MICESSVVQVKVSECLGAVSAESKQRTSGDLGGKALLN